MTNNQVVIILTTTVNVNLNKSWIVQVKQEERLACYIKAVLQWLNKTNFSIVLVENSGYPFDELCKEREMYKDRFEIISYDEKKTKEAEYLIDNKSKGASELFSIQYAFYFSSLIKSANFIIKITGRFFIPELEDYLSKILLSEYDGLTQHDPNRCEMVGSNIKHFFHVFDLNLVAIRDCYCPNWIIGKLHHCSHVEAVYKYRFSQLNNVLQCKKLDIEETQRGGAPEKYNNI